MNKKSYNIGISCIGSGVGQSVINSLRLSRLPLRTIGLGTNPFAFGAYDCDEYDYTKNIYEKDYIDDLIDKCIKHNIDLIIPGLDDEALLFAQNSDKFEKAGIIAIHADKELISICRDKERMSLELNKTVNVFVKSYDKNSLLEDISFGNIKFPFIAKPRSGFASRGIEIIRNEGDIKKINESHIIQELAIPSKDDPNYDFYMSQISKNINPQVSEVSIQVVYSPEGELMGRMFSYNKLNNGVPIEIVPYENEYIWAIIDQLMPALLKLGLKGPLNIQGRLTDEGLKLFEMNPRFTGITGLRALMGFNEVEACVKEWLNINKGNNKLKLNYNRFGVRQTSDKSIPIERNEEVLRLFKFLNTDEIKKKKTILITGAGGYLGRNLIKNLIEKDSFEIWTFDLNKKKIKDLFENKIQTIIDIEDLNSGNINLGNVDILLHLGFTRPHGTNQEIAKSLEFTNELFTRAVANQVPAIINISSQSVYGLENTPPWNENTSVAPQMVYSQAKYATELLLASLGKICNTLKYSSLRLGALAGGADGLVEVDFLSKISRAAFEGKPIKIIGGMQKMERFDIRDAVNAIIRMLQVNPVNWKTIYNLSSGEVHNLKEITEKTVNIAAKYNGGQKSDIIIEEKEVDMNFGLDCSLFCKDMSWTPAYKIENTIESLMKYFVNESKSIQ
ncbi:MAG: NAD-dependent epimerase/dehydratase family protein [Paludibacteraceae bacterium]|nr:NAD-dependent epimerase/dehydratase family protein [Paludibacteraceae bacterium]